MELMAWYKDNKFLGLKKTQPCPGAEGKTADQHAAECWRVCVGWGEADANTPEETLAWILFFLKNKVEEERKNKKDVYFHVRKWSCNRGTEDAPTEEELGVVEHYYSYEIYKGADPLDFVGDPEVVEEDDVTDEFRSLVEADPRTPRWFVEEPEEKKEEEPQGWFHF